MQVSVAVSGFTSPSFIAQFGQIQLSHINSHNKDMKQASQLGSFIALPVLVWIKLEGQSENRLKYHHTLKFSLHRASCLRSRKFTLNQLSKPIRTALQAQ